MLPISSLSYQQALPLAAKARLRFGSEQTEIVVVQPKTDDAATTAERNVYGMENTTNIFLNFLGKCLFILRGGIPSHSLPEEQQLELNDAAERQFSKKNKNGDIPRDKGDIIF